MYKEKVQKGDIVKLRGLDWWAVVLTNQRVSLLKNPYATIFSTVFGDYTESGDSYAKDFHGLHGKIRVYDTAPEAVMRLAQQKREEREKYEAKKKRVTS